MSRSSPCGILLITRKFCSENEEKALSLIRKAMMDEPAESHDQLLATKFFIPSSSHALILRPRLLTLLMKSLECPLTLVSAPAGFGKTTLLSNWVHSLPSE